MKCSDEIGVPTIRIEEELRARSPSPPPLDVLTPPPALEPFEHYNEDVPPPLSLMADIEETATILVDHDDLPVLINNELDSDNGVEEYLGTNNVDADPNNDGMTASAIVTTGSTATNKCKQVLTKKDIEEIRRYNLDIRASIYKEVRRFGKSEYSLNLILPMRKMDLVMRKPFS